MAISEFIIVAFAYAPYLTCVGWRTILVNEQRREGPSLFSRNRLLVPLVPILSNQFQLPV